MKAVSFSGCSLIPPLPFVNAPKPRRWRIIAFRPISSSEQRLVFSAIVNDYLLITSEDRLSSTCVRPTSDRCTFTRRIVCVPRKDRQHRSGPARSMSVVALGELVSASTAAARSATSGPNLVTAVTQVAVTAAAIVYGAYLSDGMLRPGKLGDSSYTLDFEGVDVTDYPIFKSAEVQKAISFAREAHAGQVRKTGEPYVTHCIHTGRILAALVPSQGKRAVDTVVAGILHDVIDDAGRSLSDVSSRFGEEVAQLVEGVSKLSHINQLLRRHRRTTAEQNSTPNKFSAEDVDSLRLMLLGMVNDPRVVLIKLADRLHNMRTIHALPPSKASAVAQETLAVWCSLASRLGVWAVKAELEDLCFAVLEPVTYRRLRAELAAMWTPNSDWRHERRMARSKRWVPQSLLGISREEEDSEVSMKDLLEAVVPFDVLLDPSRRGTGLGNSPSSPSQQPKVVHHAQVALAALGTCEETLDKELLITTPYIPGMEIMLSGRLKSLYSTYCKMRRKKVGLHQIYDARALRVVVGDAKGTLSESAIEACYSLLNVVHSLWTPVGGEFDDYILNPKPSGYQSLHTAVTGPDGAPLEVQIRTQSMHEYAEYGHAAHWLYKEGDTPDFTVDTVHSDNSLLSTSAVTAAMAMALPAAEAPRQLSEGASSCEGAGEFDMPGSLSTLGLDPTRFLEQEESGARATGTFGVDDDSDDDAVLVSEATRRREEKRRRRKKSRETQPGPLPPAPSVFVGHPALRVEEGRLLAAVVIQVENEGRDLLVAVSYALLARGALASGRSGQQTARWVTYARLLHKVQSQWWNEAGHGDWSTCLERYTLCSDGLYHKKDQFNRSLATYIQLVQLSPQELEEYSSVRLRVSSGQDLEMRVDAAFDGAEAAGQSQQQEDSMPSSVARLNNKVRLLRSMLQWEQEFRHEAAKDSEADSPSSDPDVVNFQEVLVIVWPGGDILRMQNGSLARDVAEHFGSEGKVVLVNGKVVTPGTRLKDGDMVEVRS